MYARGVNFTSLLFMNVYSIYTFICVFSVCTPLLVNWQKGKEKFGVFIYACLFNLLSFTIDIKSIFVGIKSMFISLVSNIMFMYIYVEHSRHIFIVYCYAWAKGELLWSLTLIHTYITQWVLSSSKRGRLLTQRPITLVLMMINSCSYSTNDLVFI